MAFAEVDSIYNPIKSQIFSVELAHPGASDDAAQVHRDDPCLGLSAGDVSHTAGGCYGVA
jgi:hypothetical protein